MNFSPERSKHWRLFLAAGLIILIPAGTLAAGKGGKTGYSAQNLYAQKNFRAASQAFYKKVTANPQDAESFYYLGNCAVAMKNYQQASDYYKRAMDLVPGTSIGNASQNAMQSVLAILNPPTPTGPASKAKILNGDDKDSDDKAEKKDPKLMAAEEQSKAKIADAEKAAKKIIDDATARTKPIKDDEDREASDLQSNQGSRAGTDGATQAVTEVRAPYEERIKQIMDPAKRQAQQLKDAAKKEADAIIKAAQTKK